MADRSSDQYKRWSEHRILAGILTFLQGLGFDLDTGNLLIGSRLQKYNCGDEQWENVRIGCCGIHLCVADAAATTGYVLIDVSDTVNFPHKRTGTIHLTEYQISINPTSTFVGQILLGFLEEVDDTDGSFKPIICWKLEKQSIPVVDGMSFYNGALIADVDHFLVPGNPADATWQTDTPLASPLDNVAPFTTVPGAGDMVMKIVRTAGEVNVGVTLRYCVE